MANAFHIQVPPAVELRRKQMAERLALRESAAFRLGEPTCPAGTFVAGTLSGPGCRCWVEQETITEGQSPSSLKAYCFGDYEVCPTWQAEKERIAAQRKTPLAEVSLAKPGRKQLREVVEGEGIYAIDGAREGRDG